MRSKNFVLFFCFFVGGKLSAAKNHKSTKFERKNSAEIKRREKKHDCKKPKTGIQIDLELYIYKTHSLICNALS